jgi:hypothetical protein
MASAAEAPRMLEEAKAASERAKRDYFAFYIDGRENAGWEANPAGVSGRMVRGYKHWRHKR